MYYQKEITENISKTVASYPKHLREDLSQELWVVALEELPKYDPKEGSISTFLYLHFKGRCSRWVKKHLQPTEELSPELLTTKPIDLDLNIGPISNGAREFIIDKLTEGYSMQEIFIKFPDSHGYKSLKSLYNQLY